MICRPKKSATSRASATRWTRRWTPWTTIATSSRPGNDRDFLKAGDVFSDDLIDGYIELKMKEVTRFRMSTHPVEFDMYYSS